MFRPTVAKPDEVAARVWCARLGADPDEVIIDPASRGVIHRCPRWKVAARELVDLWDQLAALGVIDEP